MQKWKPQQKSTTNQCQRCENQLSQDYIRVNGKNNELYACTGCTVKRKVAKGAGAIEINKYIRDEEDILTTPIRRQEIEQIYQKLTQEYQPSHDEDQLPDIQF